MPVTNPVPKAVAKAAVDAFEKRRQEDSEEGRRMAKLGAKKIKVRRFAVGLAFAVGAILGIALDTARAASITDGQSETIGFIAVEAVAVQRCGVGQRIDMFDGLAKNGMTIDDIASKDGKFAYVTMVTMQHAQSRWADHPAEFCAFVRSKRPK